MKQDTIVQLQRIFSRNADFNQQEYIIQSCVDGIFENNPELEDKLFKRYNKTLTHFSNLWCGNYDLMNHSIDKMDLDMPFKEYPWECDICRKYARLIVIAFEMSCNLSSRCDDLKESDLVEYTEDGNNGYLRDDLKRSEYRRKDWMDKALKNADEIAELKKTLDEYKIKYKELNKNYKGLMNNYKTARDMAGHPL